MSYLKKFFEPPAAQPPCYSSESEMKEKYRYWRIRQLTNIFIGYSVYYFVRKNISIAVPLMEAELGLSKADLGKIMSSGDVVYAISKAANGFIGDRCNPCYFMPLGLLISALANFFFGMNAALGVLLVVWCINGWAQGMGSPPCLRIMTHWFHRKELAWYWSIWALSNHVGLSVVLVLAGYLGEYLGWRYIFWVPATLAGLTSLYLAGRLRDTPASLGLPAPEVYGGEKPLAEEKPVAEKKQTTREFIAFLFHNVFNQPALWAICVAVMLNYVLCFGFVNWVPTFLKEKGVAMSSVGWMLTGFEIAGALGAMVGGRLTDKYFHGQRAPVCVFFAVLATFAIYALWKAPNVGPWGYAALLIVAGFLIYGPHLLFAVMSADVATKKAAATAVGLTGLFSLVSGLISGWGLGHMLDRYGWDAAFMILIVCSAITVFPMIICWNVVPKEEQ